MTLSSLLRPLAIAALALVAVACDQGRTNPPDGTINVVNIAPGFPSLTFSRGELDGKAAKDIAYRSGTQITYDADSYNFKVYSRDIASNSILVRKAFTTAIEAAKLYYFVLAQAGTGISEVVVAVDPPATSATDTQVLAINAGESLPAIDVFLERPGASIAAATPIGSVSFGAATAPRNVATGEYQITLTAANDRTNVLLQSSTFTLQAALSTAFVIAPEGEESLSPLSVVISQGANVGWLLDNRGPSSVRVINGATDAQPRDVAFGGVFTPPLFAAVPFAQPTAYADTPAGTDITVNVTPPGNVGVLELNQKVSPVINRRQTLLFVGAAGTLTHTFAADDTRRIFGEAQMRFYNAASQFAGVDLILLASGGDPALALAATQLTPGGISLPFSLPPGDYQLYLRQTATATIVAGPTTIQVASQGIYGVLATNGASSVLANVTLVDDFQ